MSPEALRAAVQLRRGEGRLLLVLGGRWDALALPALRKALQALELPRGASLALDLGAIERLEPAGAWLLQDQLRRWSAAGVRVPPVADWPPMLRLVHDSLEPEATVAVAAVPVAGQGPAWQLRFTRQLGMRADAAAGRTVAGVAFVGRTVATLASAVTRPRRLRPTAIVRHIWDTGITALPIVSLIAFLISVILAYLSATQLRSFGVDIFVVDLVTVGVLRELGVLLTAIIVAGRSGSAFAAEIGAMQLNEEVDALEATGVDPIETLVLPRVLGLVIALPLLTFVADIIGMAGGALLSLALLDIPLVQFINRAEEAIAPTTFWVGIWKAPVFGLLIALSGTWRGLQVRGSSRELGRLTTVAVVQSIFLVLLADALFAVLFMKLDV
ncbi:MAG: hypothetical protein RL026_47 [Pseudomonadota bacterium]|jgi:phospholipid/cholesterol/gamma-HCH transport system permease protein